MKAWRQVNKRQWQRKCSGKKKDRCEIHHENRNKTTKNWLEKLESEGEECILENKEWKKLIREIGLVV